MNLSRERCGSTALNRFVSDRRIADEHGFSFAAPDHRADPPTSIASKKLNAVDTAVHHFTAAGAPRLVCAEHVGHVAVLPRLAPQLAYPETRHLARVDHRFEIHAIRLLVEFEHAAVVDAHHARAGSEDLGLTLPVRALSLLEANLVVHLGDDRVEIVHESHLRQHA